MTSEPSPELMGPEDLPVADLHEWVAVGLARGGALLTAGEALVARRILALTGPPARMYARLSARVPDVFPVDDLALPGVPDPHDAAATLCAAGLADAFVPWSVRAAHLTVAELRAACRRLGLASSGRRDALLARVSGHSGIDDRRWLRIRHRGLLLRLARWATLRRAPDRSRAVVARMGLVRWPEYPRTRGKALHPDRRDLREWEALVGQIDELDAETALAALRRPHWPPGRLDLRRRLRGRVLDGARQRERDGDPEGARALYARLVAEGHVGAGRVAVRVARTLEAEGRAADALAHLASARGEAGAVDRVGIGRAGRRIARGLRRGWAPERPLAAPVERTVGLVSADGDGPRPTWEVGGRAHLVEDAVVETLASHGRRALHAEGALWRTLFALLFADAYFAPVPGALPVPFLDGPLDVGTPAFAARRPEHVRGVLDEVRAGRAAARLRDADARYRGVRLAGATWERAGPDDLQAVVDGLGPRALSAVLERLLEHGWRAARGLPDLVVLPGEPVRLADAHPRTVGAGLALVEVKGPGDSVRDAQAVWFDALVRAGARVELWKITPR